MNGKRRINIAIDGPSGSGKSTLAKNLAGRFGFVYVDTGALYRAVGLFVKQKGKTPDNREAVKACLDEIDIRMTLEDKGSAVYLNGVKVGDEIREPDISLYAAKVSKIPEVRQFLLGIQRETAKQNDCVMDGRDIGTVVLPRADVKIFLSASDGDRAKRRFAELSAKGIPVTFEETRHDMELRDQSDKNSALSPAIPAHDAVILDNSGFLEEQTLETAARIIVNKLQI